MSVECSRSSTSEAIGLLLNEPQWASLDASTQMQLALHALKANRTKLYEELQAQVRCDCEVSVNELYAMIGELEYEGREVYKQKLTLLLQTDRQIAQLATKLNQPTKRAVGATSLTSSTDDRTRVETVSDSSQNPGPSCGQDLTNGSRPSALQQLTHLTDPSRWPSGPYPDTSMESASMISFNSTMEAGGEQFKGLNENGASSKVEMVYSLISMLGSQHDQLETAQALFSLSENMDTAQIMRQSGCLSMVVQLLHPRDSEEQLLRRNVSHQPQPQDWETFEFACRALRNLVRASSNEREVKILKPLEQIRAVTMHMRFAKAGTESLVTSHVESDAVPAMAALMRFSFDEQNRYATGQLGGIQAIADVLVADEQLYVPMHEQPPACVELRRLVGMTLTNLTFGDPHSKALLCSAHGFLPAVNTKMVSDCEEVKQVFASVLRNLSWKADGASKETLRSSGGVAALLAAAMGGSTTSEKTLKGTLSALWNLSSHSSENKEEICRTPGALEFLVTTLTYNERHNLGTANFAVVENGGGILRNISSIIGVREEYREVLRRSSVIPILLEHLRSPSLTVVSNACGTLWNLSARNAEDQALLWSLGAVPMLKNLCNSRHKMIQMGSQAALKNLLMARCGPFNTGSMEGSQSDRPLGRASPSLDFLSQIRSGAPKPPVFIPQVTTVPSGFPGRPDAMPSTSGQSNPLVSSVQSDMSTSSSYSGRRNTPGQYIAQNILNGLVELVDPPRPVPPASGSARGKAPSVPPPDKPHVESSRAVSAGPEASAMSRDEQIRADRATVQRLHNGLRKRQPGLLVFGNTGNVQVPYQPPLPAAAMDQMRKIPSGPPSECESGPRNFASSGKGVDLGSSAGASSKARGGAIFGPSQAPVADTIKDLIQDEMPRIFATEGDTNSGMSKWSSLSSLMRDVVETSDVTSLPPSEPQPEEEKIVDEPARIPVPEEPHPHEPHPQPKLFPPIGTSVNATPDVCSRRSSLSSLDEIDCKSTVDSIYSQQPTGYCSPSELPESPCRTMPPSPKQRRRRPDADMPPPASSEDVENAEESKDDEALSQFIRSAYPKKAESPSSKDIGHSSSTYWSMLKGSKVPVGVTKPMKMGERDVEASDEENDEPVKNRDPQDPDETVTELEVDLEHDLDCSADLTFTTIQSDAELHNVSRATPGCSANVSRNIPTPPATAENTPPIVPRQDPCEGTTEDLQQLIRSAMPKGKPTLVKSPSKPPENPETDILHKFIQSAMPKVAQLTPTQQHRTDRFWRNHKGLLGVAVKSSSVQEQLMSASQPDDEACIPGSVPQFSGVPEAASVPSDLHLQARSRDLPDLRVPSVREPAVAAPMAAEATNSMRFLDMSNSSGIGILEQSGISLLNSLDFGTSGTTAVERPPAPSIDPNQKSTQALDAVEPPDDLMAFSGCSALMKNSETTEKVKDAASLLRTASSPEQSPQHRPLAVPLRRQETASGESLSEDNFSLEDFSPDGLPLVDPETPSCNGGEVLVIEPEQLEEILRTEELLIDCETFSVTSTNSSLNSAETGQDDRLGPTVIVPKMGSEPKVIKGKKKSMSPAQRAALSSILSSSPKFAVRPNRTTELRARKVSGSSSGNELGSTGRLSNASGDGRTQSPMPSPRGMEARPPRPPSVTRSTRSNQASPKSSAQSKPLAKVQATAKQASEEKVPPRKAPAPPAIPPKPEKSKLQKQGADGPSRRSLGNNVSSKIAELRKSEDTAGSTQIQPKKSPPKSSVSDNKRKPTAKKSPPKAPLAAATGSPNSGSPGGGKTSPSPSSAPLDRNAKKKLLVTAV